MKKTLFWICTIFSMAGGSFAWWVDSRNDEPQAAVLVILVVTFTLGFILPHKARLWTVIVGLCIPLGYLLAESLGYKPLTPAEPGWYGSLIALIPAFIGAYLGALGRLAMRSAVVKT